MDAKKTLEVNPFHPILVKLKDTPPDSAKDLIWMLFEVSLLTSGFTLEQPASFATRIHKLIQLGLGLDHEEEEEGDADDIPDADEVDGEDGEVSGEDLEEVD